MTEGPGITAVHFLSPSVHMLGAWHERTSSRSSRPTGSVAVGRLGSRSVDSSPLLTGHGLRNEVPLLRFRENQVKVNCQQMCFLHPPKYETVASSNAPIITSRSCGSQVRATSPDPPLTTYPAHCVHLLQCGPCVHLHATWVFFFEPGHVHRAMVQASADA